MKKFLIFFAICLLSSLSVYAATYKINTQGNITSQNGRVQNNSYPPNLSAPVQSNYYSNYAARPYVQNRQVLAAPVSTIDIVMDFSGSMLKWINAAKNSMSSIVSQLPSSTKIGLRTFGEQSFGKETVAGLGGNIKKTSKGYSVSTSMPSYLSNLTGYCSSTRKAAAITYKNPTALIGGMNASNLGGSTPLTLGLHQAVYVDFAGLGTADKKKIILITDGGENCGGDPCAFVADLMQKRNDIVIDVVLVSSDSKALMCLTQKTGGRYYTAGDVNGFVESLKNSVITPPESNVQQIQNVPSQNYEYVDN